MGLCSCRGNTVAPVTTAHGPAGSCSGAENKGGPCDTCTDETPQTYDHWMLQEEMRKTRFQSEPRVNTISDIFLFSFTSKFDFKRAESNKDGEKLTCQNTAGQIFWPDIFLCSIFTVLAQDMCTSINAHDTFLTHLCLWSHGEQYFPM